MMYHHEETPARIPQLEKLLVNENLCLQIDSTYRDPLTSTRGCPPMMAVR